MRTMDPGRKSSRLEVVARRSVQSHVGLTSSATARSPLGNDACPACGRRTATAHLTDRGRSEAINSVPRGTHFERDHAITAWKRRVSGMWTTARPTGHASLSARCLYRIDMTPTSIRYRRTPNEPPCSANHERENQHHSLEPAKHERTGSHRRAEDRRCYSVPRGTGFDRTVQGVHVGEASDPSHVGLVSSMTTRSLRSRSNVTRQAIRSHVGLASSASTRSRRRCS
jgi:hypothetical protein